MTKEKSEGVASREEGVKRYEKMAERLRALKLTPQLASQIVDNLNEGIVITDITGKILYVNTAYSRICGYTEEELLGRNPRILKSNLHDQFFYQRIWNNIAANGRWDGEIWNRHKSGRIYLQRLYIIPIRNDRNEIVQYVGVTADISEQDKIEKDIIRTGKLQKTSLPVPIHSNTIEVESIYAPSHYISGDFYDYFWNCDKEILTGYMIDIMGHGLTAAFQHSILRVLFNQKIKSKNSLAEVLAEVNRESKIYFLEDTFAAAMCFRLNLKEKQFTYSCAGMNKFIKLNKNGVVQMTKQAGPYLGIMKDADFREGTIPAENGESFLILTDGFMDLLDQSGFNCLSSDFQKNLEWLNEQGNSNLRDDASAIAIHIK